MTNVLFLFNNLIDASSVYPTSEDSELPAINLQHRFRTKVWEVDSPAADLVIDFGEAKEITTLAICNYDWAAAPNSLYMEFGTSSFTAASGQTQEITWTANPTAYGNNATLIQTFTLNSAYQFARLRVHADSVWQIGRMFMGTYFEPTLNLLHTGYRVMNEDDSKVSISVGGQEHIDEIGQFKSVSMLFVAKTRAQVDEFAKMFNHVGRRKDWFLALDYDNKPREDTLYGKFESDIRVTRPGPNRYDITLAFHEVR